ncbi:MAG TPA: SDR family NAD(P)-dependent oxidoreductase, partial [Microthrixaceae bacterium]|nr:SDR family NAD(P)-dependent oxidoreductase [Microthrixaceae bacterium]
MTKLAGAHVIVTGGSEGIGLATAQLAARRGATVSLIARRPDVLAEAAASIGGPVGTAAADVTDAAALATAIDGLVAAQGPCDVLVCCAGYALPGYFDDLPVEEFDRHMQVNYLGAVHAVRAVLPSMRARRRGHVIVTSSTAGIIGVFGYGAYSPTKFAIRGLAEVLRAETVGDGIGVGIVYPPDTKTPGFDRENRT